MLNRIIFEPTFDTQVTCVDLGSGHMSLTIRTNERSAYAVLAPDMLTQLRTFAIKVEQASQAKKVAT